MIRKDRTGILFLTNFHDPRQTTTESRKLKDGSVIEISCPVLVKHYNVHMGYVDKADMLTSLNEIDRKSKRWWLRIFWHMLDVCIVNGLPGKKRLAKNVFEAIQDFGGT